ncbi:MAG: phosphoribosylamine--glycine ligase [Termitinemataceae bacterium]
MKVLVIGSGGREHAIAWKLAQSPLVEQVYVAPGNGGTALEPKCCNIPVPAGDPAKPEAQEALAAFALQEGIHVTVVGPEAPLAAGIADRFRAAGLAVVGPGATAAQLEASQAYAKNFMNTYGVRTAQSWTVTSVTDALNLIHTHLSPHGPCAPLVIKADGLAAGKGVVITDRADVAETTVRDFMEHKSLGTAGTTVVFEEFLQGKEVSILAAVQAGPGLAAEQNCIIPFVPARDHKRRFDNNMGPNTGGMGAVAPVDDFSEAAMEDFVHHILEPTLHGIRTEGFDYRGFLFFGLMVHQDRCYLLEYNVRLGDPETQAVLPLMESDFAEFCYNLAQGTVLPERPGVTGPLSWKPGYICAPVAVAEGYPGPYRTGVPIDLDQNRLAASGARLFVAGAQLTPDTPDVLRTSGGRVLAVSAYGVTLDEARNRAYEAMDGINFQGKGCRRDIGLW